MRHITLSILAFLSIIPAALAADQTPDPNRFVVSIGKFNVTDKDRPQRPPEVRLEARLSEIPVWKLHPWAGAELIDNGKFAWYGGGFETDIDLWSDWLVLTLQTGAGYFEDGKEPLAGRVDFPKCGLEFRHTLEIGTRLGNDGARIGLGISHMSNANIGGPNHSLQAVMFNVQIPIGTPGRKSKPE